MSASGRKETDETTVVARGVEDREIVLSRFTTASISRAALTTTSLDR